jgi:GNAT superfamily N-acetyltransferase
MLIRLAKMDDLAALEKLIAQSVRLLSVEFYTSEQIESALVHVFGVDTQLIADGTYFVAEAEDQLVGCGGWSKRKTLFGGDQAKALEADSLLNPEDESARIRAFFVHPNWARRGIGSLIMKTCEAAAIDAGFKTLELAATYPGVPLYRVFGFEAIEHFGVSMPNGIELPIVKMRKQIIQI